MVNLAVRKEFVRDAANLIVQARAPDGAEAEAGVVGKNWVSRFIRRHGYYCVPQKVLDAERQYSENKEVATIWFSKLEAVCKKEGILPEVI